MSIEAIFQFGIKNPKWVYYNDEVIRDLLQPYTHNPRKLLQVVNAHIGKAIPKQLPVARLDLPSENLDEAVYCHSCNSYLLVRRESPKITSSYSLSPKATFYKTKPLEYCNCSSLAVLVDHRGILRVYGDGRRIALVNFLAGYPLHHNLIDQVHAEIPASLLDGIKPRYERVILPKYLWKTPIIDLSYMTGSERAIVLPVPLSKLNRSIGRSVMEYYQNYAYNHSVMICTRYHLILPSGIAFPMTNPYLKSLLDQEVPQPDYIKELTKVTIGTVLKISRSSHRVLEYANSIAEMVNDKLVAHYNLPVVKLKYYPYQTIGYLQIVRNVPPEHIYKKCIDPIASREIKTMRNIAISILREFINGKSQEQIAQFISRIHIRNFAKILPPNVLALSSTKSKPKDKQKLYQYDNRIPLQK